MRKINTSPIAKLQKPRNRDFMNLMSARVHFADKPIAAPDSLELTLFNEIPKLTNQQFCVFCENIEKGDTNPAAVFSQIGLDLDTIDPHGKFMKLSVLHENMKEPNQAYCISVLYPHFLLLYYLPTTESLTPSEFETSIACLIELRDSEFVQFGNTVFCCFLHRAIVHQGYEWNSTLITLILSYFDRVTKMPPSASEFLIEFLTFIIDRDSSYSIKAYQLLYKLFESRCDIIKMNQIKDFNCILLKDDFANLIGNLQKDALDLLSILSIYYPKSETINNFYKTLPSKISAKMTLSPITILPPEKNNLFQRFEATCEQFTLIQPKVKIDGDFESLSYALTAIDLESVIPKQTQHICRQLASILTHSDPAMTKEFCEHENQLLVQLPPDQFYPSLAAYLYILHFLPSSSRFILADIYNRFLDPSLTIFGPNVLNDTMNLFRSSILELLPESVVMENLKLNRNHPLYLTEQIGRIYESNVVDYAKNPDILELLILSASRLQALAVDRSDEALTKARKVSITCLLGFCKTVRFLTSNDRFVQQYLNFAYEEDISLAILTTFFVNKRSTEVLKPIIEHCLNSPMQAGNSMVMLNITEAARMTIRENGTFDSSFEYLISNILKFLRSYRFSALLRSTLDLLVLVNSAVPQFSLSLDDQRTLVETINSLEQDKPNQFTYECLLNLLGAGTNSLVNSLFFIKRSSFIHLFLASHPFDLDKNLTKLTDLADYSMTNIKALYDAEIDQLLLKSLLNQQITLLGFKIPKASYYVIERLLPKICIYFSNVLQSSMLTKVLLSTDYTALIEGIIAKGRSIPSPTFGIGTTPPLTSFTIPSSSAFTKGFTISFVIIPDSPLLQSTTALVHLVNIYDKNKSRFAMSIAASNVMMYFDANKMRTTVQAVPKLENKLTRITLVFHNDQKPKSNVTVYKDGVLLHDAEFAFTAFADGPLDVTFGGYNYENRGPTYEGYSMALVSHFTLYDYAMDDSEAASPPNDHVVFTTDGRWPTYHDSAIDCLSVDKTFTRIADSLTDDLPQKKHTCYLSLFGALAEVTPKIRDTDIPRRIAGSMMKNIARVRVNYQVYRQFYDVLLHIQDEKFARAWFESLILNLRMWTGKGAVLFKRILDHWSTAIFTGLAPFLRAKSYFIPFFNFFMKYTCTDSGSFAICKEQTISILKEFPGFGSITQDDIDFMFAVLQSSGNNQLLTVTTLSLIRDVAKSITKRDADYFGFLLPFIKSTDESIMRDAILASIGVSAPPATPFHDRVITIIQSVPEKMTPSRLISILQPFVDRFPDVESLIDALILSVPKEERTDELLRPTFQRDFSNSDKRGLWYVWPLLLALNTPEKAAFQSMMYGSIASAMKEPKEINAAMTLILLFSDPKENDPLLTFATVCSQNSEPKVLQALSFNCAMSVFMQRSTPRFTPSLVKLIEAHFGSSSVSNESSISALQRLDPPSSLEGLQELAKKDLSFFKFGMKVKLVNSHAVFSDEQTARFILLLNADQSAKYFQLIKYHNGDQLNMKQVADLANNFTTFMDSFASEARNLMKNSLCGLVDIIKASYGKFEPLQAKKPDSLVPPESDFVPPKSKGRSLLLNGGLAPVLVQKNYGTNFDDSGVIAPFSTNCLYWTRRKLKCMGRPAYYEIIENEFVIRVACTRTKRIPLNQIQYIFMHKFGDGSSGIEIISIIGKDVLLKVDYDASKEIAKFPLGDMPNLEFAHKSQSEQTKFMSHLTKKWQANEISNFEFLTFTNYLNGRSFRDPHSHPIFPPVFADMKQNSTYIVPATISISNPDTNRFFNFERQGYYEGFDGKHTIAPEYYFTNMSAPESIPQFARSPVEISYILRRNLESPDSSKMVGNWAPKVFSKNNQQPLSRDPPANVTSPIPEFGKPIKQAVFKQGKLLVHFEDGGIQMVNSSLEKEISFSMKGTKWDATGKIVIPIYDTFALLDPIKKDFSFVDSPPNAPALSISPRLIAGSSNDFVFVSEDKDPRVIEDVNGVVCRTRYPITHLAYSPKSHIIIAAQTNRKVSVFGRTGKSVGRAAPVNGRIEWVGVSDLQGLIVVKTDCEICVFTPNLEVLRRQSSRGPWMAPQLVWVGAIEAVFFTTFDQNILMYFEIGKTEEVKTIHIFQDKTIAVRYDNKHHSIIRVGSKGGVDIISPNFEM